MIEKAKTLTVLSYRGAILLFALLWFFDAASAHLIVALLLVSVGSGLYLSVVLLFSLNALSSENKLLNLL